ncbi:tetratricopeptide repeat protein [Gloeocapsopsis dulcis]|uniref:protein O-GlcNAc transferase n=1 Tax=Gloeocapsopsis dulcis AAB1 = 1H9 TaxID=1433147 RepID=A0A6N8FS17_9CHRO|nr:tetratricopeptide repeat protein [Gloeocapsopsis dulcis]MUL35554.1 glycosyltransferase [Gloeocapsopsis dulcis AAB1 = 1H9]WNN87543.1 tetratricopeptide repeat protein [Gloeocapsopsis dulcis]
MDYQKFINTLPDLYYDWEQQSVRPKSNHFQQVLEQIKGMTTANVMQLLNFAVECMEPGEVYCEIGCFQGSTLIGALLDHPEIMAYAVDNFSEFDPSGENIEKLTDNLAKFGIEEQVFFCNQDFEEFFFNLKAFDTEDKIGVYLYNGAHDYRSQLMGLLLVKPFLAEQALIIVDDSNWSAVQQANWDFIAAHPQCQMLLNLPTPDDGHNTFWNGIQVLSWDATREENYDFSEIQEQQNKFFIKSAYNWQFEFEQKKKFLDDLHKEALALDNLGCYEEAEVKYKGILQIDGNRAGVLLNLGTLYYTTNRYQLALDTLNKALQLEPSKAIHYYSIGQVLEKVGAFPQAIHAYEEAINIDSEWIDAYNNLGNIFLKAGKLEEAESIYQKAIAANPNHFGSYLNLGNVLMERRQVDAAVETYEKALRLKPRDPDILHNLGVALDAKNDPAQAALYYGYSYYRKGEYQEAIDQYQQFLATQTGDVGFYVALADCYKSLNQYEKALETYQAGIQVYPKDPQLYFFQAWVLRDFGKNEEAIAFATEASKLLPDSLILKIEPQFLLPVIYETEVEIEFYRNQFTQGLHNLIEQTPLDTPEAINNAVAGIGSATNFYLQYQAKNDLELQKQYGEFVHKVMAAKYPQWVQPLVPPSRSQNQRIRVGYISNCMRGHTVGKLMLGWIRNCNHQEIEVYCYYVDPKKDSFTQQFQLYSDTFHHIPNDLEAVCNQIVADQLHVLVYLDIGMFPQMTQMAGLRLAPVQCMTWGHPITSGSPTIDYFLSSDLMEPENAQEHYSEKLIRLPNISISYAKRILPEPKKSRLEFRLREDAVIYLSCQSLFKCLPQYDYVFAAIAQRVPQAQFVFLANPSAHITGKFQQRLKRAFANFGLDSEDYCIFLPRLNTLDYFNLNQISDIFLDTFTWSGGNTTLEAIACNLPIVTYPGEFMRGRHSYAILKMLGITDTIAENEAEYIKVAVKLGLNKKWRNSIVEQMMQRHPYLYDDKTCVEALDAFFRYVVQKN